MTTDRASHGRPSEGLSMPLPRTGSEVRSPIGSHTVKYALAIHTFPLKRMIVPATGHRGRSRRSSQHSSLSILGALLNLRQTGRPWHPIYGRLLSATSSTAA